MESPNKRKRTERDEDNSDARIDPVDTAAASESKCELEQRVQDLEKCVVEIEQLNRDLILRNAELTLSMPRKTRAARTLTPLDSLRAFDLKEEPHKVEWKCYKETPAWILQQINRSNKVVLSKAVQGEAFARLLINPVMIAALEEQERHAETQALALKAELPGPLRLAVEERLERTATLEGEVITVQGIADYTIHYENPATDRYGTGLVAIEAKRRGGAGFAMGQLIAYMGIIFRERKARGKESCTVWGFASDGYEYIFARVSQQGLFARTNTLPFDEDGRGLIFGLLCGILNAAAFLSPSTSRLKDAETHWKRIKSFESPERSNIFDYGVSESPLEKS